MVHDQNKIIEGKVLRGFKSAFMKYERFSIMHSNVHMLFNRKFSNMQSLFWYLHCKQTVTQLIDLKGLVGKYIDIYNWNVKITKYLFQ